MTKKLFRLHYRDKNGILIQDGIVVPDCLTAYQSGLKFAQKYGLKLVKVELMFSYKEKETKNKLPYSSNYQPLRNFT